MKSIITIGLLIFIVGGISAQTDNSLKRVYIEDVPHKSQVPVVSSSKPIIAVSKVTELPEVLQSIGHYKDYPTYI